MKETLQRRMALTMWLLAVMGILASALLTGSLLIRNYHESVRRQLESAAAGLLTMQISDFSELGDLDEFNLFIEDALDMEKVEMTVRVFDYNGHLLFSTLKTNPDFLPERIEQKNQRRAAPKFRTFDSGERKYESLLVPYEIKSKNREYFLEVMAPLPRYSEILKNLWWQSLLYTLILTAISLLVARNLTERLLQPVTLIAEHLEKMDPNHVETWSLLKQDHFGTQGLYLNSIREGINSLTEKTKASVSELRKMSRYVAHELRTPLTILQGEAENILSRPQASKKEYEDVLKSSLDEVRKMSETVTTVLQIGEWERAVSLYNPQGLDLISWAQEHIPGWEKTLGWKIDFKKEGLVRANVFADPKLFYYLVDNLIRNIRTHTPAGTECCVEIKSENNQIILNVIDHGPGLSQKLIEALSQKSDGYALSGVGLNLCQKISKISHLDLQFSNLSNLSNHKASGLKVSVTFEAFETSRQKPEVG